MGYAFRIFTCAGDIVFFRRFTKSYSLRFSFFLFFGYIFRCIAFTRKPYIFAVIVFCTTILFFAARNIDLLSLGELECGENLIACGNRVIHAIIAAHRINESLCLNDKQVPCMRCSVYIAFSGIYQIRSRHISNCHSVRFSEFKH